MEMVYERCADYNPTFVSGNSCFYYEKQSNGRICGLCKHSDHYRCLADLGVKPLPLSHSAVQDFLICKRLFYIKNILGLQVRNSHVGNPLKMGALWDRVLQWYYGNKEINIQEIIDEYDIAEENVAIVRGLYRAYRDLNVLIEDGGEFQARVNMVIDDFGDGVKEWGNGEKVKLLVRGFYDRKYDRYFVENKLSSRPDGYLDTFFIQSQIGTYFLGDPKLEYCIMEVVRTPSLRITKGEELSENYKGYENRVYEDVMGRPGHYFVGWNKETRTYGKKFYRTEFDLDEIRDRYKSVFKEIYDSIWYDSWYKNDRSCRGIMPGMQCDYIGICRYNNFSESVYTMKEKEFELDVPELEENPDRGGESGNDKLEKSVNQMEIDN